MKLKTSIKGAICAMCLGSFSAQAYDIAAYYWPAYHPEPRWQELGVFKDGKGEWQNVYEAVPKFVGHYQPRVPIWGYTDESDPEVMAKKIDAAADYGVNVFIFDWYWYEGKPFLEEALNNGFLKAKNKDRMKFFLMWANHNVIDVWDNKVAYKHLDNVIWSGEIKLDEFKKIADRVIEKYFKQPNYYKIDGKPVFSIYELGTFIKGVGGVENAKAALDYIKKKAVEAGLEGVHIQTMCWNLPKGLQGVPGDSTPTSKKIVEFLGIDSFTSYQWVHYRAPGGMDYKDWGDWNVSNWDNLSKTASIPYFCHVSIGWDNNMRYPAGRFTPIVMNSNPAKFEEYLRKAKDWTDKNNPSTKLITVNSWNEWTEGSYLEPDEYFGWAYLEAVRRVFKKDAEK